MNIAHAEADYDIVAKTCGCEDKKRKVTYTFVDSYHSLCRDKKDIILSEIQACERLLKYTRDENDKIVLEKEIAELKLALDMLQ
jgi:hypothetical protein